MAMPRFKKSAPAMVQAFDTAFPTDPRAERRQMFGYPAGFVNGNMFAGLFGDTLFVRLGEAERGELLRLPGASVFEPMPGRPMREYVVAPPGLVADSDRLKGWMTRALEYAASLPAKRGAKNSKKAGLPGTRRKK